MKPDLSIADSLPHRPPALLVTEVSDHSNDTLTCVGRIPIDHPSVVDGLAPVTMAVELAAQASGLLFAIRDAEGESAEPNIREGYLVSLQRVELLTDSVPAEATLIAQVGLMTGFGHLAMFHFRVDTESETVTEGNIGVAIAGR